MVLAGGTKMLTRTGLPPLMLQCTLMCEASKGIGFVSGSVSTLGNGSHSKAAEDNKYNDKYMG